MVLRGKKNYFNYHKSQTPLENVYKIVKNLHYCRDKQKFLLLKKKKILKSIRIVPKLSEDYYYYYYSILDLKIKLNHLK